jgi:hypothetical protein
MQVHLGYIKPYMIVPARGQLVQSTPRPWLTAQDIKAAFFAARLKLSEFHVRMLMDAVLKFSQSIRVVSVGGGSAYELAAADHEGSPAAAAAGESVGSRTNRPSEPSSSSSSSVLNAPVLRNGMLNALWFRQYMVHLRLHRPSIPFTEWLGGKLVKDGKSQDAKPKNFRRALAGRPYDLSREEIDAWLQEYELLPEEILEAELDRRVEAFVLDMSGRMDFKHQLLVLMEQWKDQHPGRHTEEELAAQTARLTEEICEAHRKQLAQSEEQSAAVTKELFWAFDEACKTSKYTRKINFGDWLKERVAKGARDVETFRKVFSERAVSTMLHSSRKHTYAPLNELEHHLKLVMDMPRLPQIAKIKFRKAINSLKRVTVEMNLAKGRVISKEAFDKEFSPLLNMPHEEFNFDPVVRDLAIETRKCHEWRRSEDAACGSLSQRDFWSGANLNQIFTPDAAAALQRSLEFEQEVKLETDKEIKVWMDRKMKETADKKIREVCCFQEFYVGSLVVTIVFRLRKLPKRKSKIVCQRKPQKRVLKNG